MKISKEVRIGLLVSAAILIFFIGFNFLKNSGLFSGNKEYYCYYQNVDGLQNSATVQVNGLNVGHVSKMELAPGRGVKVTITVTKDVSIPDSTIANLDAGELLGAKTIQLIPGPGPGELPSGSELMTSQEGGMVDKVTSELTPRLRELKGTIGKIDTTISDVNSIVGAQNQQQIAEALHSINTSAKNIEQLTALLNKESVEITSILRNANEITGNLARQSDTIRSILANANKLVRNLSNAPIEQTVTELRSTIAKVNDIAARINKNEGSLGMLINDKTLHTNLNRSLKSLDSLMSDIKAHPNRYINVTVFGSGKKKD
jgi:phospholipid/cholesterol/gamma-HCH transport system substrate-binding protein